MKKIQPKIFLDTEITLDNGYTIADGYSLGQTIHFNDTGNEYYHSTDGIWKEIGVVMPPLISLTYSELKDICDTGKLIPGRQYRITNYVTNTVQADTQSAGHQFDIIITADSVNVLNQNARACLHEGDYYFIDAKIEAWQLKYSIDNDNNRFLWSSAEDGVSTGVIYYMKDEWNNECSYDFKNIQFKRKISAGAYDPASGVDTWVYTFTWITEGDVVQDLSLVGNKLVDDGGSCKGVFNNVIYPHVRGVNDGAILRYALGLNTFICSGHVYSGYFDGCYENIIGVDSVSNTFGDSCSLNILNNSCSSNVFGNSCRMNRLGNGSGSNKFGQNCNSNILSENCGGNIFGLSSSENNLGSSCTNNIFGSMFFGNIFGAYSTDNSITDKCARCVFGMECKNLSISGPVNSIKQYFFVDNGLQGTSYVSRLDLYDASILEKSYQVNFKQTASGKILMLWASDTGAMTGMYKTNKADAVWKNLV